MPDLFSALWSDVFPRCGSSNSPALYCLDGVSIPSERSRKHSSGRHTLPVSVLVTQSFGVRGPWLQLYTVALFLSHLRHGRRYGPPHLHQDIAQCRSHFFPQPHWRQVHPALPQLSPKPQQPYHGILLPHRRPRQSKAELYMHR